MTHNQVPFHPPHQGVRLGHHFPQLVTGSGPQIANVAGNEAVLECAVPFDQPLVHGWTAVPRMIRVGQLFLAVFGVEANIIKKEEVSIFIQEFLLHPFLHCLQAHRLHSWPIKQWDEIDEKVFVLEEGLLDALGIFVYKGVEWKSCQITFKVSAEI